LSEKLDALSAPLAPGSRVSLRTDIEGHPRGTPVRVLSTVLRKVRVVTPGGVELEVARDQVAPEASDAHADRALDEARDEVILEVTVGSRAWGLDESGSDEDVRGVYLASFDEHVSLHRAPPERRGDGDAAYWEVEKAIHQALRADPNTLEMLWSPLVKRATPLGQRFVDERGAFTSRAVLGSFGRYAIGQLRRVERALDRREVLLALIDGVKDGRVRDHDSALAVADRESIERVARSLRDRGLVERTEVRDIVAAIEVDPAPLLDALGEHRPKNAYNLVRLLHSCRRWLDDGEPMIRVEGAVRDELLAIKRRETPIEDTLARARELWADIESAAARSRLPEAADTAAAEALLNACRRRAARRAVFVSRPADLVGVARDAPVANLRADRVQAYLDHAAPGRALLVVSLTGAHAYGFPSPDSDLDLKAIHVAPPEETLQREPSLAPIERIEDFDDVEHDLSSHELGQAVSLLLKGNGNMLERLLGPWVVFTTPAGERLAELARGSLSRRSFHHYRGFLGGMRRELAASGHTKVKRALYAYRVALTGLHLLEAGELVTDVTALAPRYDLAPRVDELVELKARAELAEHDLDKDAIDADLDALERRLADARGSSVLPEAPANAEALDRFVVDTRLSLAAPYFAGS
jgi:predicted nucleotidyltransferase